MLQILHAGLPWYAAIPVSALIVRGLVVLTLGSRVRENTGRYVALHPLRKAISIGIRDRLSRKGGFTSPKHGQIAISRAVKQSNKELDNRWTCSLRGQLGWSVAQLPIFMIMQDVLRRMTAALEGLWGMALNSVGLNKSQLTEGRAYSTDIANNPWFEPSLANEGMLWFPDLLVPDPTGILPYAVSVVMLANIALSNNTPTSPKAKSSWQRNLRITMMCAAASIGPLCQGLPASLMLYWLSSSCSAMLWNVYLDQKYPAIKGIAPCTRPVIYFPSPSTTAKR
jgi:inner membrane protein COX18